MTLLDQRPSTNHAEVPLPSPPKAKWWIGPAAVLAAAVVTVGGIAVIRQGDETESVEPAPEFVDTYTPSGAQLAPGVLDGVYTIPERSVIPRYLLDVYTPEGTLRTAGVLDGMYTIPERSVIPTYLLDVYTPEGTLRTAGVLDGVFAIPEAPVIPSYLLDVYTPEATLRTAGVLDGVFAIPEAPELRLAPDTWTAAGTRPLPGRIDGVYDAADLPAAPVVHPCRIHGPC